MKIILDVPDDWGGGYITHAERATAKIVIPVKFDIDLETGLSVMDEKGTFQFEGQFDYFSVARDKS